MDLNINGTALQSCTFNGAEVSNITVNGVEVWSGKAYLLKDGVATALSGGFTHYAQTYASALNTIDGALVLENINSGSNSRVDTVNTIDWSKYKTFNMRFRRCTIPSYTTLIFAILSKDLDTMYWLNSIPNQYKEMYLQYSAAGWTDGQVSTFDISKVKCKTKFMFGMLGNIGTLIIEDIWLE